MPQDWNIGHLIKLARKGNLKECKNYRGIANIALFDEEGKCICLSINSLCI
jgi:hypothetical protein